MDHLSTLEDGERGTPSVNFISKLFHVAATNLDFLTFPRFITLCPIFPRPRQAASGALAVRSLRSGLACNPPRGKYSGRKWNRTQSPTQITSRHIRLFFLSFPNLCMRNGGTLNLRKKRKKQFYSNDPLRITETRRKKILKEKNERVSESCWNRKLPEGVCYRRTYLLLSTMPAISNLTFCSSQNCPLPIVI